MKKLVAISLVLVLVSFSAFADFGGAVIGSVTLMQGDNDDTNGTDITSQIVMNRLRVEGWGETEGGNFGAWLRFEGDSVEAQGHAWWKPIDQFLMRIGKNGDGFYGKEGVTGWGFIQTPADTKVTFGGDNVWGGDSNPLGLSTRNAFYGGMGDYALMLEIKPVDMVGFNIALPYGGGNYSGGIVGDVFANVLFQADINLAFGNLAFTFKGNAAAIGSIYAYAGITAIENIGIDVGIGVPLPYDGWMNPMAIGVGVKVGIGDSFGLKARLVSTFAGDDGAFTLLFDIHPSFKVTDTITVFLEGGVGMKMPDVGDTAIQFHVNPYLQVGEEWGAKFLFGFKLAAGPTGGNTTPMSWAVPIALMHSF